MRRGGRGGGFIGGVSAAAVGRRGGAAQLPLGAVPAIVAHDNDAPVACHRHRRRHARFCVRSYRNVSVAGIGRGALCTTTTAGNGVGMSAPSSSSSTTRTLKRMVRVVQKIPLTLKRVLFTRFRYSHLPASTQCGNSEDGFRFLREVRRGRWRGAPGRRQPRRCCRCRWPRW